MITRNRAIAYGLLAAAIWGGMYVVSKVVLEQIPPFTLLAIRLLLGAAALGVWLRLRAGWPRLPRRRWLEVLAIGMLGYGISLALQFIGTRLSTAANGAVITAATPAFVYLFASPFLGESIAGRKLLALMLASVGVLAVVDPRQASLSPELWRGNLVLVGAALTWALYSVLVRRATRNLDTLTFTLVALLGGLMLGLPAAAVELGREELGSVDATIMAGVLYLGLVSTAVAFYLWNRAFESLEAGTASLTFFAQPVVGALLGAVLLGEVLGPLFLLGAGLILLGIWLAARARPANW